MTHSYNYDQEDLFNIEVVHCKKDQDSIYIGRGSVLGNPFKMDTEDMRDQVCKQYEDYFYEKIECNEPEFLDELTRLVEVAFHQGYVKLGCFCAPRRCHGDTVKTFLNSVLN